MRCAHGAEQLLDQPGVVGRRVWPQAISAGAGADQARSIGHDAATIGSTAQARGERRERDASRDRNQQMLARRTAVQFGHDLGHLLRLNGEEDYVRSGQYLAIGRSQPATSLGHELLAGGWVGIACQNPIRSGKVRGKETPGQCRRHAAGANKSEPRICHTPLEDSDGQYTARARPPS